jgi:hypothetical protein
VAEQPWEFVSCPNCHLNRFAIKRRHEEHTVQAPKPAWAKPSDPMPPQTKVALAVFQIICDNCRAVLVHQAKEVQ